MVKKPISRRSIPGRKQTVRSRPLKKRRRILPRPKPGSTSAVPIRTAHGPLIVRQAIRHLGELFSQRDSSHFVHEIFTECGLVYPHTITRYFPPINYFTRVNTPLAGDVVVYAEHMGIYAQNNKFILADPAEQQVLVSTTSSFLNFVGYYRWYQDLKK
jgi:hypothetical protein